MEILGLIFFAMALNMDALGAGVSYGIKRIKLPLISILIISFMSMAAISLSMSAGQLIAKYIRPDTAQRLGGILLVIIGVWAFYQYLKQNHNYPEEDPEVQSRHGHDNTEGMEAVTMFQISIFGVVIQVLRKPHLADMDMSGVISWKEALILGMALALDSMAAGIAVSFLGYSVLTTALFVGSGQIIHTYIGLSAGNLLSRSILGRQISVLPGIILILLGITKI
ncbi:MAG: sporulation membrane protein YtaF [Bacillota bacterium]